MTTVWDTATHKHAEAQNTELEYAISSSMLVCNLYQTPSPKASLHFAYCSGISLWELFTFKAFI